MHYTLFLAQNELNGKNIKIKIQRQDEGSRLLDF